MEDESRLSNENVMLLKEYCRKLGLGNVSFPFTAREIRENFALVKMIDAFTLRIVQAFAQVDFVGMPTLPIDKIDRLITYFIMHPSLLSKEQFISFFVMAKKERPGKVG
jgi:hypothetical protein